MFASTTKTTKFNSIFMCIYYLRSIFQIERRDLYEIIEHGYRCPVRPSQVYKYIRIRTRERICLTHHHCSPNWWRVDYKLRQSLRRQWFVWRVIKTYFEWAPDFSLMIERADCFHTGVLAHNSPDRLCLCALNRHKQMQIYRWSVNFGLLWWIVNHVLNDCGIICELNQQDVFENTSFA